MSDPDPNIQHVVESSFDSERPKLGSVDSFVDLTFPRKLRIWIGIFWPYTESNFFFVRFRFLSGFDTDTVEYNLYDGERTLVRWNRPKIDLCTSTVNWKISVSHINNLSVNGENKSVNINEFIKTHQWCEWMHHHFGEIVSFHTRIISFT